jgi:hypothetical protein
MQKEKETNCYDSKLSDFKFVTIMNLFLNACLIMSNAEVSWNFCLIIFGACKTIS